MFTIHPKKAKTKFRIPLMAMQTYKSKSFRSLGHSLPHTIARHGVNTVINKQSNCLRVTWIDRWTDGYTVHNVRNREYPIPKGERNETTIIPQLDVIFASTLTQRHASALRRVHDLFLAIVRRWNVVFSFSSHLSIATLLIYFIAQRNCSKNILHNRCARLVYISTV